MEQIRLGEVIFNNSFNYLSLATPYVDFTFSVKHIKWPPYHFNYDGSCEDSDEFLIRRALPAEWKIP